MLNVKKSVCTLACTLLLFTGCQSDNNDSENPDINACFDTYSKVIRSVEDSDSLVLSDVIEMSTESDDGKQNAGKIDSTLQVVVMKDNKNDAEKAELTNYSRYGEKKKTGTYKNGKAVIDDAAEKDCTKEDFEKQFYVNILQLSAKDIVSVESDTDDFGAVKYTAELDTKSKTVKNIFVPDKEEKGNMSLEKAELALSVDEEGNVEYWTYDTEHKFKQKNGSAVTLTMKNSMSVSGVNTTVVEAG
jgi:hypothetical protein